MTLEEFSCHCEIVYEEIQENIEKILRAQEEMLDERNEKRLEALEMQLNDLNDLVHYIYEQLNIYIKRKAAENLPVEREDEIER